MKVEGYGAGPTGLGGAWRSAGILHQLGLLPLYADQVLDRVRAAHGEVPPASLVDELALVRSALVESWRPATRVPERGAGEAGSREPDAGSPKSKAQSPKPPGPTLDLGLGTLDCPLPAPRSLLPAALHVFIGPPGSGKTTALCKWLAKAVLVQGRSVRVWRLDGRAAHLSGLLDFHAEVLGATLERQWQPNPAGFEVGFIDLPALDPQDVGATGSLLALPSAQVHLVLNAAYDAPILLTQARAFSALPVHDIIFTHLDEELRLAKLWNVVLGTNFTVRFLSAGQNIPGDFFSATAERLLPPQILG